MDDLSLDKTIEQDYHKLQWLLKNKFLGNNGLHILTIGKKWMHGEKSRFYLPINDRDKKIKIWFIFNCNFDSNLFMIIALLSIFVYLCMYVCGSVCMHVWWVVVL